MRPSLSRALVAAACLALAACALQPRKPSAAEQAEIWRMTAEDGVVYGYPLLLMDATRALQTAVAAPDDDRAPVNRLRLQRTLPDARTTDVSYANVDALYVSAWLDLAPEPQVLVVPDPGQRFTMLPLLDAWSETFARLDARGSGRRGRAYALVGPGWQGDLPDGVQRIDAPTAMVWLLGRVGVDGRDDLAAARRLQARFRLLPLSAWNKRYAPPKRVPVDAAADTATPPAARLARMDAAAFFGSLAMLLHDNPPRAADAPLLARLATLGVVPGRPFDPATLPPAQRAAVEAGVRDGLRTVADAGRAPRTHAVSGWSYALDAGRYGIDYRRRAAVAAASLGASAPQDAVYPFASSDAAGQALDGAHRYVLHFDKDALPPVGAFWSLTAYDAQGRLVASRDGRYALDSRDRLRFDKDGSLDLYLQRAPPARARRANWLPLPAGVCAVVLRLYAPKPEVLDGRWAPPPIGRAD